MNNQRAHNFLLIALGITAVLLATSLLLAVVNLGAQIASFWFLLVIQIALVVLAASIVVAIVEKLFAHVFAGIAQLNRQYDELFRALKKRTPWFVVSALLVSQASLAIADKSFQGQNLPTVAVTLVLIILFFVANELITRDECVYQVIGFLVWFFAVLSLPFFVWADRDYDTNALFNQLAGFPLFYKVFYFLCFTVFILLPLLFVSRRDA